MPEYIVCVKWGDQSLVSVPRTCGMCEKKLALAKSNSEVAKEMVASHKERMETLKGELRKVQRDILNGQMTIVDVMHCVANQVNSGALDTKNLKVTCEVTP